MRTTLARLTLAVLIATPAGVLAEDGPNRKEAKRVSIDAMAADSLERLFEESPEARGLFGRARGYAVFDNFKVALGLTGGGGVGVAVDKFAGHKTYMKMGTAGIGLGVGGQSYQVVFLFEDGETYQRFVTSGWQADASANAAAGTTGKNADSSFSHGLSVFQLTNKGLLAQVDLSGTKYWKSRKLNAP